MCIYRWSGEKVKIKVKVKGEGDKSPIFLSDYHNCGGRKCIVSLIYSETPLA